MVCTGEAPVPREDEERVGYCISTDRYMKHENVGIIYQLNVVPEFRRSLVGAALIQAVFDRAAYGCRLFCCWCAQDIEANRFWESIGFIPLAFRAGSRGKRRVHIFWQRRVRADDDATPYWFPSQTSAGAIGEDRLVLPIPPGTHWSDAKPILLPSAEVPTAGLPSAGVAGESRVLGSGSRLPEAKRLGSSRDPKPRTRTPRPKRALSKWSFQPALRADVPKIEAIAKPPKLKKPKQKNDPKHVAAARELNALYMEQFNSGAFERAALSQAKHAVSRQIAGPTQGNAAPQIDATPKVLPRLLEQRAA